MMMSAEVTGDMGTDLRSNRIVPAETNQFSIMNRLPVKTEIISATSMSAIRTTINRIIFRDAAVIGRWGTKMRTAPKKIQISAALRARVLHPTHTLLTATIPVMLPRIPVRLARMAKRPDTQASILIRSSPVLPGRSPVPSDVFRRIMSVAPGCGSVNPVKQ